MAAYDLFPDFVGGRNERARTTGIEIGREVLAFAMRQRGDAPFIAGNLSLADLYLAPILAYVSLTSDAAALLGVDGVEDWWARIGELPSFHATWPA